MEWFLYAFAGWLAIDVIATIAYIGKPRKPVTPKLAVFTLLIHAGWITLLVLAAVRLSS
jgi:hypothetical protein